MPIMLSEESIQTTIQSFFTTLPEYSITGSRFFILEQQETIIEYLKTQIHYLMVDPLSAQKRQLAQEKQRLVALIKQRADYIALDASGEPEIITRIQEYTQDIPKVLKSHFIQTFFVNVSLDELNTLSRDDLDGLYSLAVKLDDLLQKTNHMLNFFTDYAKLSEPMVFNLVHQPQPTFNPRLSTFRMNTPNITMGYTLHNLLWVSKLFAGAIRAVPPYDGSLTFELSADDLETLNHYLNELKTWYKDFDMLISSILREEDGKYTKTGQKPLSEVLKTEIENRKNGRPVLINESTFQQMLSMPQETIVLLIGQVALDLTSHPDKFNLRAMFESLYKDHQLLDSKQHLKTFIKDIPYQFVSLLSIPNIQAILDDLMDYAVLTNIAKEMGFDSAVSPHFYKALGLNHLSEAYHLFLYTKLTELPIGQINPANHDLVLTNDHKRNIRTASESLFPAPYAPSTLHAINEKYFNAIGGLLDSLSEIQIKPAVVPVQDLTDDEIRDLLPTTRSFTELYPMTTDDFDFLMVKLKSSPGYQNAIAPFEQNRTLLKQEGFSIESLDTCLNKLTTELKARMVSIGQRRSENMYYGYGPFLLAKQAFMTFISKICYQSALNISQASINEAFKKLPVILYGGDLQEGCEKGLAGRMNELKTTVRQQGENPIDEAIAHLKSVAGEKAFQSIATGGESSSLYLYKEYLYIKVGILPPNPTAAKPNTALETQFMNQFKRWFKPSSIFNESFETLTSNLKNYLREDDDQNIYNTLQFLGFGKQEEIDKKFHFDNHKWNFSKMIHELPEAITKHLLNENIKIKAPSAPAHQEAIRPRIQSGYMPANWLEERSVASWLNNPAPTPCNSNYGNYSNFFSSPSSSISSSSFQTSAPMPQPIAPAPVQTTNSSLTERFGVFASGVVDRVRNITSSQLPNIPENTSST